MEQATRTNSHSGSLFMCYSQIRQTLGSNKLSHQGAPILVPSMDWLLKQGCPLRHRECPHGWWNELLAKRKKKTAMHVFPGSLAFPGIRMVTPGSTYSMYWFEAWVIMIKSLKDLPWQVGQECILSSRETVEGTRMRNQHYLSEWV